MDYGRCRSGSATPASASCPHFGRGQFAGSVGYIFSGDFDCFAGFTNTERQINFGTRVYLKENIARHRGLEPTHLSFHFVIPGIQAVAAVHSGAVCL